jgi:hypothetical protein
MKGGIPKKFCGVPQKAWYPIPLHIICYLCMLEREYCDNIPTDIDKTVKEMLAMTRKKNG